MKLTGLIQGCGLVQRDYLIPAFKSLDGCDAKIFVDWGKDQSATRQALEPSGITVIDGSTETSGAAHRNLGGSAAGDGFVLWISPDDIVKHDGITAIRERIDVLRGDGVNVTITEKRFPNHRFMFPRLFRASMQWRGRAHEYFDGVVSDDLPDVVIEHQRGPWHDAPTDPMGIRRLLAQDMADDPKNPRWVYYYAREFFDYGDFDNAAIWFMRRSHMGGYPAELADAYLYLARCQWQLHNGDEARKACAAALTINSQFREAARFMQDLVYPHHRLPWKAMESVATNENVLFIR